MKPDTITMNLDEEFKAGLNVLRPFILRLSSVEDAKLTRLWLEKLHEAVDERKLRNIFLRELTDQVQCGKLRFPFNKPPPMSPLYLCQDGGGERYSSSDSYSGSSRYFNPRGDAPLVEKRVSSYCLLYLDRYLLPKYVHSPSSPTPIYDSISLLSSSALQEP
uniref:DUF4485 domain-containing protein n=1 Tax=Lygus hesperus TaxID=30085 RepID=A0A0A9W0C0_LYGHE